MKVKELIEQLQKHDPEAEAVMFDFQADGTKHIFAVEDTADWDLMEYFDENMNLVKGKVVEIV